MFDSLKNELTRRQLLNKAGLGLVAVSVAGAVGAVIQPARTAAQPAPAPGDDPLMPPEKKLGWAIVGLGKFATQQLIPSFGECKRSKLVALVSSDRAKAERIAQQYGVNPKNIYNYQNYDTIRNNLEFDVIYIVLPNSMHTKQPELGGRSSSHQPHPPGGKRAVLIEKHHPSI